MQNLKYLLLGLPFMFFLCTKSNDTLQQDFNFGPIDKIEVEVFLDDVSYIVAYKDGSGTDYLRDAEFSAEFSTVAGSSYFTEDEITHYTDFDNPRGSGKLVRGDMEVVLTDEAEKVSLRINQRRNLGSLALGEINEEFENIILNVPRHAYYPDNVTDQDIFGYRLTGSAVCSDNATFNYEERNQVYDEVLNENGCSQLSYVAVKIFMELEY